MGSMPLDVTYKSDTTHSAIGRLNRLKRERYNVSSAGITIERSTNINRSAASPRDREIRSKGKICGHQSPLFVVIADLMDLNEDAPAVYEKEE